MGSPNPRAADASYFTQYASNNPAIRAQFEFQPLIDMLNTATVDAKSKLAQIKTQGSAMSIADMFEMQLLMNKLSQMSEMSSTLISAVNGSISTINRNLK